MLAGALPLGLFSLVGELQIEQRRLERGQQRKRSADHGANQDHEEQKFEPDRHLQHRQDEVEWREKDHDQEADEEGRAIGGIGGPEVLPTDLTLITKDEITREEPAFAAGWATALESADDGLL
nr:hypothetical protein [Henriciella sp.]